MSRFSPQVLPEPAPDQFGVAAHSVADAIDAYRQRKRQDQTDVEATQDRARRMKREDVADAWTAEQEGRQRITDAMTQYQSGYRSGAPPTDGGDVASQLEQQRGNLPAGSAYDRQRAVWPAGAAAASPTPAGPAMPQRGNLTAEDPGYQQAAAIADPGRGTATQSGDVATMLERQRMSAHIAATPVAGPPPVDPHPVMQLGRQYYTLPGQNAGYIDLSATPEARAAAGREWHPHTQQEAHDYELGIHPERLAKPEGTPVNWTTETLPDGRVIQVNPQTGASRPITRSGARLASPEAGAAGRTKAEEELTQGDVILNSTAKGGGKDPLHAAFGAAYQGIRETHPNMDPRRIAFLAMKGLKGTRPDLFPAPPSTAAGWRTVPDWKPGGEGADSTDAGGAPPPANATARRPPLTAAEKARAASDPGFVEFLKGKGYKEGDY